MVFRRVFSGITPLDFPREEADRTVGTAGVEAGCCRVGRAVGRSGVEGERSLVGLNVEGDSPEFLVMTGRLFLGLLDGKGGRAVFGGSIGGRDEMGSAVATVVDMVMTADGISIRATMDPATALTTSRRRSWTIDSRIYSMNFIEKLCSRKSVVWRRTGQRARATARWGSRTQYFEPVARSD